MAVNAGHNFKVITSYLELLTICFKNKFKLNVIFVGFFNLSYIPIWILFLLYGKKYSIWSLGQISKYSIKKNLFSKSPIISEIKDDDLPHLERRSIAKPVFIYLTKFIFHFNKPNFWIFSEFEKKQINFYFKNFKSKKVLWVCHDNLKSYKINKIKSSNFESKKIMMCWSRIDVKTKGIDRFLKLSQKINEFSSNYLSITCGPHYSGDIKQYKNFNNWSLIDTKKAPNSNISFGDANFIVLLSRWDGFPRVLREAVTHKIPIIISEETHFSELVNLFKIGVIYNDNELEETVKKILDFNFKKCDFKGALNKINSFSN